MDGQRDGASRRRRLEHIDAVEGVGVQHQLTGPPGLDRGKTRDEPRELGAGDGDHDEIAPRDDVDGVEHRHVGEHRVDAVAVGACGDPDDRVPRAAERRAHHRTHPACADDPDTEPAVAPHGDTSVRRASSLGPAGADASVPGAASVLGAATVPGAATSRGSSPAQR